MVLSIVVVMSISIGLIVLRLAGGQLLAVQSNSMQPVFAAGDALIVLPVQPDKVRPGEIVSYRSPTGNNMIVSHRAELNDATLQTITTKGDAQKQSDAVAVSHALIIGEPTGVVPGLGRAMTFMRHPVALIALVYTPMVLLLAKEFERLYRHYTKPSYQLISRQ